MLNSAMLCINPKLGKKNKNHPYPTEKNRHEHVFLLIIRKILIKTAFTQTYVYT